MGLTVKQLRNIKEGEINDLKIATNLIDYALTYDSTDMLFKIDPLIAREALINYVNLKNE